MENQWGMMETEWGMEASAEFGVVGGCMLAELLRMECRRLVCRT
jgi:hypothetical protein